MALAFSLPDLTKIRQVLAGRIEFKSQMTALLSRINFIAELQTRPAFPKGLEYLEVFSERNYPKGKLLVLVHDDIYSSVKGKLSSYVLGLAYEGYYATSYRIKNDTPESMKKFIDRIQPVEAAILVGDFSKNVKEMDSIILKRV
ncbi:MAG: hypothetical protein HGA49_02920 [Eubacteriaceae bacterium]|nr:hypothetical protein [Eubacteriaceae bacterium]